MEIALFPSSLFRQLRAPSDLQHHLNVLLSVTVVAALFLSASLLDLVTSLPHFCLMERGLGLPCPGCGMTGALAAAARGELSQSAALQPCALGLVGVLAVQSAARLALVTRQASVRAAGTLITWLDKGFLVALIVVWVLKLINAAWEG